MNFGLPTVLALFPFNLFCLPYSISLPYLIFMTYLSFMSVAYFSLRISRCLEGMWALGVCVSLG